MRIPLMASSLMIGLGLLIGLAALASGVADAQQAASPVDQFDERGPDGLGFDPMLVPAAALAAPGKAPTLWPPTGEPDADLATLPSTPVTLVPSPANRQDPTAGEGPPPTATTAPIWAPDRLVIPAIELDAPVVPSGLTEVATWGQVYQQWVAPNRQASGWHTASATLGTAGNTVLNGHHNIYGEVFGHLADLKTGDLIWVYSGARAFVYRIVQTAALPERWQPIDVRLANAQWIQPSEDERLTLVTCWPYTSNTHRLIVVAMPVDLSAIEGYEITPRRTPHPPAN